MNNKPTILYVDDEEINQMLFEKNLNKYYNVITANNGFEGLDFLKNRPEIKLVVSDMKMPMMNGLEFIKKAKEEHPRLPFFLLTGFDVTPQIREAVSSQLIVEHFKKPFNVAKMHNVFLKATP